MANSFGVTGVAKQTALAALVNSVTTFKMALFLSSATRGPTDSTYSTTGELAASGNYTQGGNAVTNGVTAGLTSTTAYWTPGASVTWSNLTSSGTFDCAMLYNTSGSAPLALFDLGDQDITAGNFTLTMPTNDSTTGLIRIL